MRVDRRVNFGWIVKRAGHALDIVRIENLPVSRRVACCSFCVFFCPMGERGMKTIGMVITGVR